MKRKIVRQGKQAFTITLPVDWIRNNGLNAGDEIDVETREKNLFIRTDKKSPGGFIELDLEGDANRIKYLYINAVYAKGIDELKLKAERAYYPEVGHNIGFAVVSQKNGISKIRDISGVTNENLDEIFKRVFQMIINFMEEAIADVFGERKQSFDALKKKDMEINKFCLFLERSIMKQTYPEAKMGKILFSYAFYLEVIADDVFRLWRACFKNKPKGKDLRDFLQKAQKALEKAFAVYYRFNHKDLKDAAKIKWDARKKIDDLLVKYPKHSLFIFYALKIIEGAHDLAPLALMKQMKPKYI